MIDLSIIIPCYNEAFNACVAVSNITKSKLFTDIHYEIIVSDDGSRHTFPYQLLNQDAILLRNKHLGKGGAIKAGIKKAQGRYILLIDADMQISIDHFKLASNYLKTKMVYMITGNKYHSLSVVSYSIKRWIISKGYRLLRKILFNFETQDTQCGFKLINTRIAKEFLKYSVIDDFAFDVELITFLEDNKYSIKDIPIFMEAPKGSGSVSMKSLIQTFVSTIKIWVNRLNGKYIETKS